ncbi:ABC transporter ATP-binding protein [Mesorhizobium sp.]|uniref:ABC transporter ATP-binding protein n=1 Tax=Mesorhizobium sp. TaxID=1871066 RepID=UPI000FE47B95|nr:ABC transporter ATP-binding protein [Mesorhizobium sp.]RWC50540.1 MAG: ABC transporter ATP-binding protein [Mesorhizobium sp.]RWC61838.1 MAG: ABC transporter ATP-binding protein [Mesorhizobium sp.]RWC66383.1 MAG: ABC transporter ATP-binding protein [Mesorhizobium sp.]
MDALTLATKPKSADIGVDNVALRYGTGDNAVLALDGISFHVAPNEFCVIVGPSGCGKSSLLYLIAGLEERTGGTIAVGGKPVTEPGPDRGMVFQAYTLFPWLTVAQNVEYGPKRKGMSTAERRAIVEHFLNEVGLAKFANHYPSQLSGGMKQRVAIARALANDPQVLLMDEPFGALDSQTRHSMQKLLLKIWDHSKKTVLFVTHDIDEAILLADRVLVMSGRPGQIKKEIRIGFSRPRSMDLVMEPNFIAMKREILELLKNDEDDEH